MTCLFEGNFVIRNAFIFNQKKRSGWRVLFIVRRWWPKGAKATGGVLLYTHWRLKREAWVRWCSSEQFLLQLPLFCWFLSSLFQTFSFHTWSSNSLIQSDRNNGENSHSNITCYKMKNHSTQSATTMPNILDRQWTTTTPNISDSQSTTMMANISDRQSTTTMSNHR